MSDRIEIFGPGGGALSREALAERLEAARLRLAAPFSPARKALVAGVAERILRGGGFSPAVTHFGFWTRAAALAALEKGFMARLAPDVQARPRGLAFHLPPQNVETVFLYSWALAYLVGAANVVRLPAEMSGEMRRVLDLFLEALAEEGEGSQLFLTYPSGSDLGAAISSLSDVRLVWGGSAKVATFATLPLRDGGKSLSFGDRFSFSVLDGAALAALDAPGRDALAARLRNDVFVFDQMACASPHNIYIVGERAAHLEAAEALLAALSGAAAARGYAVETGHAIRKMVSAFSAAASGEAEKVDWADPIVTAVVDREAARRESRVGGGYLRLAFIPGLEALPALVRPHDQTITHFGFAPEAIRAAASSLGPYGVSRWAPVGAALDFDFIWDGYDIPLELVRCVRIQC